MLALTPGPSPSFGRGGANSLLPWVYRPGMRGPWERGLGERRPGLLQDLHMHALSRAVLPAHNQQFQPGAAGDQFRQAAAV
jgi:2-iminoacetate synthase ThiH